MSLTASDNNHNSFNVALPAGGTQTFSQYQVVVNIGSVECIDYSYLCVLVSNGSGASYIDADSTNNYACLTFGAYSDGLAGIYQCSGISTFVTLKPKNLEC